MRSKTAFRRSRTPLCMNQEQSTGSNANVTSSEPMSAKIIVSARCANVSWPRPSLSGTSLLQPELIRFQRDFARAIDRPAQGAMAVYRNTIMHGAIEALRANYPVVEQIVGEEMFEHVAVDFASTCP